MSGGYTGRMGFVDLSTGEVREEQLDENLARDFIGGYGLGVRILYERQKGGHHEVSIVPKSTVFSEPFAVDVAHICPVYYT